MSTKLMGRGGLTSLPGRDSNSYLNNSDEIQDNDANDIIKLQLKKPKKWNWELSTSKSSPNIAFPRIMLYNEKGKLLADAQEADCVFGGDATDCRRTQSAKTTRAATTSSSFGTPDRSSKNSRTSHSTSSLRAKNRRSSTTNLPEINEYIDDLVDQLESSGINYKLRHIADAGSGRTSRKPQKLKRQQSTPHLYSASEENDENYRKGKTTINETNNFDSKLEKFDRDNETDKQNEPTESSSPISEIPILVYSERGMLQRDLNAKEFSHLRKNYTKSKTTNLENIRIPGEVSVSKSVQLKHIPPKNALKSNKSITPVKEVRFDLQKSKSAIDFGNVEKEKKLCRRTNSSGPSKFSGSILERMSAFKRRSSSTDSQDVAISVVEHGPRYFLRTSKAGTIVVCEENFRNRRVRRRPKSCPRVDEFTNKPLSSPAISQERIVRKHAYPSATELYHPNEDPFHYDDAIAKIDKLISSVSSNRDSYPSRGYEKSASQFAKHYSVGDIRVNDERLSKEFRIGSAPSINCSAQRLKPTLHYLTVDDKLSKGSHTVSAPAVNYVGSGSKQRLTVEDAVNRECVPASETKSNRRRRNVRRCASATIVLMDQSSDEEEKEEVGRHQRRSRSKSRTRSRDELRRRTVQLGGLNEKFEDGDQILTLNNNSNNLTTVQSIGSSADIIDEPSDEVLLRLVQRLASIKQSQKDTCNNSSDVATTEVTQIIKEDENKNYRTECINIADCEDYHNNNNNSRPVQRQTTLLSHELLLEEHQRDVGKDNSDDELSDVSNEYISYTIDPVNTLNGYGGEQLKGYFPDNSVTNRPETDKEIFFSINDNKDKFVATNEQPETNKEVPLGEDNMGSNVSRNSEKGLTGRRTQSSGNLYSGKREHHQNGRDTNSKQSNKANTLLPGQGANYNASNVTANITNSQNVSETCPGTLIMSPLCAVSKSDRNKFCGSLPNHLDTDDIEKDSSISDNYIVVENSNRATERIEYVTVAPRRTQQEQQQFLGSQHAQQQQHSPYNNSLSEKETASTSSGSSTFKINQDRPDIQLKLPLTRSNFDPSCDQGYGSERSPEDEFPPPMPNMTNLKYQCVSANHMDMDCNSCNNALAYDFITKDCTFPVQITKGPRGLGLSISGGIDSNAPFPGLIRIKRLFPHQAAWSTGQLQPGDIILEVNGISLTGLTNYEALEVLRTMPNEVLLLICRPNDEQYQKLSPPAEPPKPPQRTQQQGTQTTLDDDDEIYPLQPLTPLQTNFTGEFEIVMVKQQGSLGFTLRKEDESVLGHYVRALVREPATTDGRIKPGDKIVAVNDVPLSAMTHEQAVIFLRQAADTVKLRLYRDEAQTPVAAMSPTNSENKTICGTTKKVFLRPEAINLLSDLAYKKQTPSANSTESSIKSTNSSPRRLKRGAKSNNSEINSQSEQDTTDSKSSSNLQYIVSSQSTSVCSDSEQSVASQCSYIVQPADPTNNELFRMASEEDRPDRPSFLDLTGQSGSTPMVPRRPRFQFSVAANAYELNNLDNDALDAPIYTGNTTYTLDTSTTGSSATTGNQLPNHHEFTSLPCETFLIACKTESDLKNEANFSHKNPLHQSFHVQQNDDPEQTTTKKDGNKSLLKWKGVMFTPEEEIEAEEAGRAEKTTPRADSSCAATAGTNPLAAGTEKDFDLKDFSSNASGHKVITVELNRGWNSRLGFSLQPHPETHKTVISAIYNDSVAARDGRLKVGDQLLTVNEESIESMHTSEIIELMRIIRGSIVITVLRKDFSQ